MATSEPSEEDLGEGAVRAWLEACGLGSYSAMVVEELGYDSMELLRMRDLEIQELARDCIEAGMPPAHANYLKGKLVALSRS